MREAMIAVGVLVALFSGCAAGPGAAPEPAGQAAGQAYPVKVLLSKAEGHFFRGNYLEAIAAYTETIALDPKNAPAYRGRAAAHAVLGKEADALADYGRAVTIDPRFDDAWLGRGLYLFSRGRYADAIDDFDQAAALDPRNPIVHRYRALACDKVGRLREAAISRQAYIHCETAPEEEESAEGGAPARELKALGLEK
jgi:tetratricopeptide (TPR) repeat protein